MFSAASKTDNVSSGSATYVEDVFSTYLYTGNGYSQTINNGIPLGNGQSGTGGSIFFDGGTSRINVPDSSLFTLGNAWCIEAFIYPTTTQNGTIFGRWYSGTNNAAYVYYWDGSYMRGGAFPNYNSAGGPVPLNQWTHVAMTFDGTTKRFFINGSLFASYVQDNSITSTNSLSPSIGNNTGGGAPFPGFISNLRVVSGSAVYTSSFTVPSAPLTAISGTSLLCGQGPSPLTDNSGNGVVLTTTSNVFANTNGPFGATNVIGKGGLVWTKIRSSANDHILVDTNRGTSSGYLTTNADYAQSGSTYGVTGFTTSGYTTNSDAAVNGSGSTFVSWTFAKQAKFFDIQTYTGSASAVTINHNLGSAPGCVIIKCTSNARNWMVWHRSLTTSQYLYLNTTDSVGSLSNWISVSSTQITIQPNASGNPDANYVGRTYVAYIFAHDAGGFGTAGTDNVISCGSYTGTSAAGNFVNLGYEPQFVMIKNASGSGTYWGMWDNMRGIVTGGADPELYANTLNAENGVWGSLNWLDVNATGFTPDPTGGGYGDVNASGSTYIYIAIRRGPMKTPTSGTSVFNVQTYTGNSASNRIITTNFPIDANLTSSRNSTAKPCLGARLFDGMFETYDTGIPYASLTDWINYDSNTGYTLPTAYLYSNDSSYNYVSASFRRAPNFHDVVCYSGTGSATTINHNLGVAPELIIVRRRNQAGWNWAVYASGSAGTLLLDQTSGAYTSGYYAGCFTSTSATTFGVNTIGEVNGSGGTYVAWMWASCPGVSKVGSYTGTGGTQTISCGFAARWLMIKRTDSTGNWWVWDTARGMVAGTDPRIQLNTTTAEQNANWVYTDASGFQIVTTDATVNASGGSYIFLAVA